jgi:hypothetical protein
MAMRNFVRIFVVAAFIAALMPPVPVYAVNYEVAIDYWDGCDATFTYIGDAYLDCSGSWTYTGSQAGTWKRVMTWNCNTEVLLSTLYYHYCNGTWVLINPNSLGACDLDC